MTPAPALLGMCRWCGQPVHADPLHRAAAMDLQARWVHCDCSVAAREGGLLDPDGPVVVDDYVDAG